MDASHVVGAVLDTYGMSQVELAAALNVSQAAVSQWVSGARRPSESAVAALTAALSAAHNTDQHSVDAGLRRGPVRLPASLWAPAFRPTGRFRLPLRLEWSGSDTARWHDAADIDSLLYGWLQIMSEGSVADMVCWIDPVVVAAHFDEVLWSRGYAAPWAAALHRWGLKTDATV